MSESGSTLRARRAVRQAVKDQSVSAIVLHVDSPGGTVAGTADLANEVRSAAKQKRVVGYVEDLAASAACWVVSQCSEVYANAGTAQIGSIGTFLGLYDVSGMAEKEGVKPVVIKAGEFKAGGFPGTQISEAQIAEWQKVIDATQKQFTEAIAEGRRLSLSQAESLVTGLTYIASEAESLGLIDGVRSFDSLIEELQNTSSKRGRVAMSEQQATYQELVTACHGLNVSQSDDAMFLADCQSKGLSLEKAVAAWSDTLIGRASSAREELQALSEENAELKSKVAELESQLEAVKPKSKGVPAVGTKQGDQKAPESDPLSEWKAAVQSKIDSGMSRSKAVASVNRENPGLREALVAASN